MSRAVYGSWRWRQVSLAVRRRDGWRCTVCGRTGVKLHADHVVPLSRGGAAFDPANLRTVCTHCHALKTNKRSKRRNSRQW